MEIIEAIEKLKDSHALVCLENRALIKMEKDKVSEKDANECDRPFNDLERNAVYVCEHGYAVSKNRSKNVVDVVDKITR